MTKFQMIDMQGNSVEEIELSDAVFNVKINEHVVYLVVKNILANRRQGTQSAKTRAEVRGGGRKPWRQRAPVVQDKVPSAHPNGEAAASCLHRSREAIAIPRRRRFVAWR